MGTSFLQHVGKIGTREFLKASPFQVFSKLMNISAARFSDASDASDLPRK